MLPRICRKGRKLMRKLSEEKLKAERERLAAMRVNEAACYAEGYSYVIGVDEVGRGPLCGPVTAAACVLPADCEILFLNDSKKLSEKRREALFSEITEKALAYGIGMAEPSRIDEINILNATFEAMRAAIAVCSEKLAALCAKADDRALNTGTGAGCKGAGEAARAGGLSIVLVDGDKKIPKLSLPEKNIIKGDGSSVSIAAASVLAKVTRDRLMYEYDAQYPGYGFAKNKGYGTKEHIAALKSMGKTPIHRASFIRNFV